MAEAVLNAPPGFVWMRRLVSWQSTENNDLTVLVDCADSRLAAHWHTPVQRTFHFHVHPALGVDGALQGLDFTELEGSFEWEIGR